MDTTALLTATYEYKWVALSVIIAVFSSYAALDLAGRVTASEGRSRGMWLLGGALVMGTGIWAMHFIGMLAFRLPIPVHYHALTVLESHLAAVLASAIALSVVSRSVLGTPQLVGGGLLMGMGITVMHYSGMAAMRLDAQIHYSASIVVLSVLIAIAVSFVGLWLVFHLRDSDGGRVWRKLAGALVMGAAIPTMHYTGMAAAQFESDTSFMADLSSVISISLLGGVAITIGTVMVLGLTVLISLVDRRLATQASELERTNRELRAAMDKALEATKLKSQFLANMSHEIRTPMNGVLGMTELLLNTELSKQQRHLADTVYRSGTILLDIINDILDFSKIEAGKLSLDQVDFDLRDILEETTELFANQAHRKQLELACQIPGNVSTKLKGDPGRLRQIVTNMLGNALKFTEAGEVGVRVSTVEETNEIACLRLEVWDTGIGIPLEVQQTIFEAFSQGDNSSTRKYGGTGLGLAIVRELVRLMGGEIGVQSRPGQGSTFWFTVRLQKQPEPRPRSRPRPENLRGIHVLIVDDNATNRHILEEQVAGWGMVPFSTASGPEALAHLAQDQGPTQPYGLAILDRQMPEMDGVDLAAKIKAHNRYSTLPLIMLTSVGDLGDTDRVRQAGIAVHLTKPVRQSQLYNSLLGLIAQRGGCGSGPRPAESASPNVAAGPEERTVNSDRPLRILLVEDNPINQEMTKLMLDNLGVTTELANNGLEALAAVRESQYDLILMDCQMPRMDGFATTRAIRALATERDGLVGLPIVALTAHAMQGDRELCLAAGMDDYIAKPFTQEELRAMLGRWLPSIPRTPMAQP